MGTVNLVQSMDGWVVALVLGGLGYAVRGGGGKWESRDTVELLCFYFFFLLSGWCARRVGWEGRCSVVWI